MKLANPEFIPYLGAVFAVFVLYVIFRAARHRKINFSNFISLSKVKKEKTSYFVHVPDILKIAGVLLLIIALLGPRQVKKETREKIKGIDIVMALDLSGSMQAGDLEPNRLEAAKDVCRQFINGLANDRVGLVVFAGKAFTQCPLTIDYEIVKNFINEVDLQTVRIDGTAMGDAVITAINRLESSAGSKVIILTTDGVNNRGLPPIDAASASAHKNIKLYTIGIGKKGGAPMMYTDRRGVKRQAVDRRTGKPLKWEEPDEKTLKKMAAMTGGRYFRATNKNELKKIYDLIGKLEKKEIKVKTYNRHEEKFYPFLIAGFICLLLALLLEVFKFTRIIS